MPRIFYLLVEEFAARNHQGQDCLEVRVPNRTIPKVMQSGREICFRHIKLEKYRCYYGSN